MKKKDYPMDWNTLVAIITAAAALFSALAALYSARNTNESIRQQREQWVKQEFVRREADVLFDFRAALRDSEESISWVRKTLLTEQQFARFVLGTNSEMRKGVLAKHFAKLNNINSIYYDDQLIFRKHNVDKKMPYIFVPLDVIVQVANFSVMLKMQIDEVADSSAMDRILAKMNSTLFKEIVQKVRQSGIRGKNFLKPKTEEEIAYSLSACHLTLSLAFLASFEMNTSIIFAIKNDKASEEYVKIIMKYLNEDKSAFGKEIARAWEIFEKERKKFLFDMDKLITFEGKIPEDIAELEKLSYPSSEKIMDAMNGIQ